MRMKTVKSCEACKQPFEADPRAGGHHAYCSTSECQRERRRRSQRHRRAAKSSFNKPSDAMLGGGANSSRLQSEVKPREAETIAEDAFMLGLMSMLCDTSDLDELRGTIMRLRKRGQKLLEQQGPRS